MTPTLLRNAALAAALALTIGGVGADPAHAEHDVATTGQADFEKSIHRYLLEHPDVVVEVIQLLRERDQAAEAERNQANLVAYRDTLLNDPTSPVAGNPEGDVTIVEFFDYHCSYCKRALPGMMAMIEEDPGVRVVYKEFPILGPDSVVAAKAALASLEQDPGKYLEFHNAMMSSRGRLTESVILQIAGEVGFDADRLRVDMEAPEIEATIERNRALAEALGISGTPAFIIGSELVPGAVDLATLRKLVASARAT